MRGIDPATWTIVSPLLDRAVDLDPAERAAFLAELRTTQPSAAMLLAELLAAHDRLEHSDFLQSSAVGTSFPALAGTAIGAYTLETLLGMGGMGTVWKARRSDGRYEGAVAVKLLHLAIVNSSGAVRFKREGTLLARLSHPHIARLLDAGVTPGGQPYLVLEYVEGVRLDEWADQQRSSVADRLRLLQQVADAVAHAHAHLIVHRDLKPSNILVDAHGQVKLLDFGIATLVGDDGVLGERTLTAALTPEYASPEQMRGEAVTTATDVYALGVILYRLLAGAHPTSAGDLNPLDHARAVVEREPRPLSAVFQHADPEALRAAACRSSAPERLRRLLAGDLDTLVVKALAKDPARRYASAAALAEDIGRYLRHEPIAARPDRWTYRARKFVRRHRAGVAAAALVAALLTAAAGITTTQMLEARRQRDQAEFQARRAQASSEFMRFLVTQIGTTPMTMREVLDRGRVALEQQYSGDPAFVARMLMQLSGPYIELGDFDSSAQMMARALQIATTLDDAELLAATHCGTAFDLAEQRDLEGARRHLAEAAAYAQRAGSSGSNALCAQGATTLALAERRYDDGIRHARQAVELLEAAGDTTTTRYTSALSNLANAYSGAGRLPEALAAHRRVTEVSREIGRGETIGVVVSLHNQASNLQRMGRWIEADRRASEAADLARRVERTGGVPAYILVNRARLLVSLDRGDDAMAALAAARGQGGLQGTFAAGAKLAEGLLRIDRGDVVGARAVHRELNPPERTALAPWHAHMVTVLGARIARAEGRLAEARAGVDRAIAEAETPGGLSSVQPELLEYAARLALEAADLETAAQRARHAIRAADVQFGADVPNAHAGRARLTLALALAGKGDAGAARSELEGAAAALEASAGIEHPWTREARTRLAALAG